MNDAMLRQRIHDILERKIEMEGGAKRRRRRRVTHGDRIIINKHGKPVSYKKHMQGVRLAREYGFRKKGGRHRKMRGGGMDMDDDDMYGYGYVPDLYTDIGPRHPLEYCYKGHPGPELSADAIKKGAQGPVFYNPHTGKCEDSLYGLDLTRARNKYAKKAAKKYASQLKPLNREERQFEKLYGEVYNDLMSGEKPSYERKGISMAQRKGLKRYEEEDLIDALSSLIKKTE